MAKWITRCAWLPCVATRSICLQRVDSFLSFNDEEVGVDDRALETPCWEECLAPFDRVGLEMATAVWRRSAIGNPFYACWHAYNCWFTSVLRFDCEQITDDELKCVFLLLHLS